jgi:phosphoribosylaminoimidazolecarboxamide formyltransferase/IMP cyclohydrolase
VRVRRALVSASNKNGLSAFAGGLRELGVEIVSTAGTAGFLEQSGVPVTRVEDVTGSPELLDGRVKTLHPAIHAGILARRDAAEDMRSLADAGIEPIDLVVCNLYPFAAVAGRRDASEADVIENIDIGGPTMIRAAAKNFTAVGVVVDPDRYGFALDELRSGGGELSLETRRELATEAFAHCAAYDIAVSCWFSEIEPFPDRMLLDYAKVTELSYGENPHQRAAFYRESGARRHLLSRIEQLGGKPLSFNNLVDLNAARSVVAAFQVPACAIVKHANPCGAAVGATPAEAFTRALDGDTQSAFGGIIALNRPVDTAVAERISKRRFDVLFAPGYEPAAVETLRARPELRILDDRERRKASPGERDLRRVLGGVLLQDRDIDWTDRGDMDVVTAAAPSEKQWGDLLFAWRIARYVRSNAIVLVRDLATVGIGAGQMSRVDSVRMAVWKAGDRARGAAMASDGFIPFADGPELALEAGVAAIIQPGGSVRDDEVRDAVDAAGAAMVHTHRRHFSH